MLSCYPSAKIFLSIAGGMWRLLIVLLHIVLICHCTEVAAEEDVPEAEDQVSDNGESEAAEGDAPASSPNNADPPMADENGGGPTTSDPVNAETQSEKEDEGENRDPDLEETKPRIAERYNLSKANSTISKLLSVLDTLINVYTSTEVFQVVKDDQRYEKGVLTQDVAADVFKRVLLKCRALGGHLYAPDAGLTDIQAVAKVHGLNPETDKIWVNIKQDPRTALVYYPVTGMNVPTRWDAAGTPGVYTVDATKCYVCCRVYSCNCCNDLQ